MKRIYYILLIMISSCTSKHQNIEINNLKDAINFIDNDNTRIMLILGGEMAKGGNSPRDLIFFNKANEIINKRNKIQNNDSFLINYSNYLKSEYKIIGEKDSIRIKRADSLILRHIKENDSLSYYQTLTNLALIENDLLKSIRMRFGTILLGKSICYYLQGKRYCKNE